MQLVPEITIQASQPSSYAEVSSICHHIDLAHSNTQDICFYVSEDNRLYCTTNQKQQHVQILPCQARLVSLHSYLTSNRRKILNRKRIELAVKLACSILQYNETPWFAGGWRKEHIYFFEDALAATFIDVDHPLILEPFPHALAAGPSAEAPEPEHTLLDFGVLLMELYHGKTFEEWLQTNHPEVDIASLADVDLKQIHAWKWYKTAMPKHADFRSVVGICLLPRELASYEPSWEDEDFRCEFYRIVVVPLLKL